LTARRACSRSAARAQDAMGSAQGSRSTRRLASRLQMCRLLDADCVAASSLRCPLVARWWVGRREACGRTRDRARTWPSRRSVPLGGELLNVGRTVCHRQRHNECRSQATSVRQDGRTPESEEGRTPRRGVPSPPLSGVLARLRISSRYPQDRKNNPEKENSRAARRAGTRGARI
jgi:hypothetical protein